MIWKYTTQYLWIPVLSGEIAEGIIFHYGCTQNILE